MTPDEARADFMKQVEALEKKFRERAELVEKNKVQLVTNACLRIEGTVKRLMRATFTSLEYTNPVTGNLVKNKRPRSVPDAAPAPDAGTLMRSYTHEVDAGFVTRGRVGSTLQNPPYPAYLEYGTTKMAPRPSLGPAVEANNRKFGEEIRAVLDDKPLAAEAVIE